MTVTLKSIEEARETLQGIAKKTPMIESPVLGNRVGGEIYFKYENLQKTGSFKIRGAVNRISHLTDEEAKRGVIAASAGNHAQGVALGATSKGIKATIVMPATTPMAKISATKGYGGNVILHGAAFDDAYARALEVQKETNAAKGILDLLEKYPYFSQKDVMDSLGLTEGMVKNHFNRLKKEGRIFHEGPDKGGYWRVNATLKK